MEQPSKKNSHRKLHLVHAAKRELTPPPPREWLAMHDEADRANGEIALTAPGGES